MDIYYIDGFLMLIGLILMMISFCLPSEHRINFIVALVGGICTMIGAVIDGYKRFIRWKNGEVQNMIG